MFNVAMVVMIVGMLKPWINSALIAPRAIPMPQEIRKQVAMLPPCRIMITVIAYSPTVAIAEKEMSMPPEMSTMSTPMAKIPRNE